MSLQWTMATNDPLMSVLSSTNSLSVRHPKGFAHKINELFPRSASSSLPRYLPKITNLSSPSFCMTCPKKPFCLSCIVLIRALSLVLSTFSFVTLSIHLILHMCHKNHISPASNLACIDCLLSSFHTCTKK